MYAEQKCLVEMCWQDRQRRPPIALVLQILEEAFDQFIPSPDALVSLTFPVDDARSELADASVWSPWIG